MKEMDLYMNLIFINLIKIIFIIELYIIVNSSNNFLNSMMNFDFNFDTQK